MNEPIIEQLEELMPEVPAQTIISRKVLSTPEVKATIFGFAAGEELTEHTAASPAILHFLSGEAAVQVGEKQLTAVPGTWVYLPARLPHSIVAQTAVTMLLYLVAS